jgi:hypothetical protein
MMKYEAYLEPIIEEFTTGEYYGQVFQAKEEYFKRAGEVFEDDAEFEQRMCIFMDWYIFDRDLPGIDLPPVKYYFRKHREGFSNEETGIYRELCSTIHSVFRLKRFGLFNKNIMILTDLFSGKSYKVQDSQMQQGFSRGDIFEARLIPFKGVYEYSKGFCFHPQEIKGFIVNEIKKVRFQEKAKQTKLILQLSAMKLDHLRFHHIDVKEVYSPKSKFRSNASL